MQFRSIIAALTVSLGVGQAYAETLTDDHISYSYFNVGYQQISVDVDQISDSIDLDGMSVGGSVELDQPYFIFGSIAALRNDSFAAGFGVEAAFDVDQLETGIGFYRDLSTNTDFVGTLSYIKQDAQLGSFFGQEDSGAAISAGVRTKLSSQLEFGGAIQHAVIEGEGETGFNISADYFVQPWLALQVSGGISENARIYGFGIRLQHL